MLDHIFLHIPATAGIAVRSVTGSRRIVHDLARNHYQRPVVCDRWAGFYKFTIVRNPYDRLVSICAKVFELYRDRQLEVEVFRAWVANGYPDTRVHQHAASPRMCTPQHDYLHAEDGELLVDWIGRYEHLDEDVGHVCREIGVPAQDVPRMNVSSRIRDYRPYYDAPTWDTVTATYAADLAAFYNGGSGEC